MRDFVKGPLLVVVTVTNSARDSIFFHIIAVCNLSYSGEISSFGRELPAGLFSSTSTSYKVCHVAVPINPYSPFTTTGIALLANDLRVAFAIASVQVTLEVP